MNLELADIEVFIVLSEELHFSRTAERLHISPARVSQRIKALEREIGGALFERTSRRVVLTPLGRRTRDGLRQAYDQLTATVSAARASARAPAGPLRIGFTTTTGGEAFSGFVHAVEHTYPDIEVSLREVPTDAPLDALRHEEVDVLVDWLIFEAPDITLGPALAEYDVVLVTAAGHPLAERPSVRFEQLADYEVNDAPRLPRQTGDRWFFPLHTPSGRPLRLRPINTWPEALSEVARGASVHVTVASMRQLVVRSDIVFVPIEDLPPVRLGLIWRTAHENALIRALAQVAHERRSHQ